jgi:hypothetical protein
LRAEKLRRGRAAIRERIVALVKENRCTAFATISLQIISLTGCRMATCETIAGPVCQVCAPFKMSAMWPVYTTLYPPTPLEKALFGVVVEGPKEMVKQLKINDLKWNAKPSICCHNS